MLDHYVAKQLSSPTGLGGKFIFFIMNRQNRSLYEETIRLLSPSDTDSILDIGCGNGYMLNMLARQYDCALTGIDISKSIVETACQRNRAYVKTGKMTLSCQNLIKMNFSENSFGKAYTVNTVYFWENLNDSMARIKLILEPGGLFINTLYTNETLSRFTHTRFGYKRFTEDQLVSAGADAGFATDVIPIFNGAAYCVMYRKG